MKLRLVVPMFVILAVSAYAQKVQGCAESENAITSSAATPQLNLLAYGPMKGRIGWQFWGIASRTWSEGYVGPTYSPTSWLTLAVGTGAETGGFRLGYSASGQKGKFFYLAVREWGQGSGNWHKNYATYGFGSRLSLGIWNEHGKGTGPTVNIRVYKGFSPYVAVLASNAGPVTMVGATYSFSVGREK